MKITPITVPKDTVSDETYRLLAYIQANGSFIAKGSSVCEMETSKTVIEISSPESGYLFFAFSEGADVPVGGIIAAICEHPAPPDEYFIDTTRPRESSALVQGARISKPALALMAQHGLGAADFPGKAVIGTEEVSEVLRAREREAAVSESRLAIVLSAEKPNLVILGGGGHAKMCIDLLKAEGLWNIVGILDSIKGIGDDVLGVPIIGRDTDENMKWLLNEGVDCAVNGIGLIENHKARAGLNARLRFAGFRLPTIVHPRSVVESSARIDAGVQIMAGAIVGSDVTVGDGCILNSGSVVSHDCRIGKDVHIAPGAILAGRVSVGDRTLVGMGTTVYFHVRIGKDVLITNGANVMADVNDGETVRMERRS